MYIPIHEIISRHKADIKGILHLGAHLGEEAQDYHIAGIFQVIWVEGNPTLVERLKENVSPYPQNKVFNLLISDKDNSPVSFRCDNVAAVTRLGDATARNFYQRSVA